MFTLSQFKEMYPPQAGARLLAERTSDMDGFDNMVVYELSLPAPVSMTGLPLFLPYDRLNHWWRVRYWANARRNRARAWRKYLSGLAVRLALAAEAEGRVQQ